MTRSRRPEAFTPNPRERTDQATVVNAVRFLGTPPGVLVPYMLASLSGVALDPRSAALAKQQGLEKGWPDLMFFKPTADLYRGLAIELKRVRGGRVSDEQIAKHELLRGLGWDVQVCYGWREALHILSFAYPDVFPPTS